MPTDESRRLGGCRAALCGAVCALLALLGAAGAAEIPRATRVDPIPAASPTYKLTTEDVVNVVVFGEPEFATTTRIGKDGAIQLYLVGLVKIVGQNIRDASKTIEGALREYLVKPEVALTIVQYTPRRITILGQVNKPGLVDLPAETSVNIMEAIAMAGGFTRIASSEITIKRTVGGQEKTFKVDTRKLNKGDGAEPMQVLPGDRVNVGERLF